MPYNPEYDLSWNGAQWYKDLAAGAEGEAIVTEFLTTLENGTFEVKYDRYRNGRMVVETDQNTRLEGWKPSGINTTQAQWWVYVFAPGAFVMVETERLKRWLRTNRTREQKRVFAEHTLNPAQGYLLYPNEVADLLVGPEYD